MNVLIIQPPIAQLNTAYPSGAYLSSFFKSLGYEAKWLDLNIALFYEIFSKKGLTRLFSLCSENALRLADKAEKEGDEATAFNLRRYVSQKNLWIQWIDFITAILRPSSEKSFSGGGNSGFENAHRFVFGAHVPRGARMENYLANLEHDLTTDDARSLASFALADLADFIQIAFDKNFSLVRYAESLTVSESSFEEVAKGADSPILKEFYEPMLKNPLATAAFASSQVLQAKAVAPYPLKSPELLVLISIPFPGTFAASLATGRFFKERFGDKAYVCFGGGFVNTELRETKEVLLAKYCDAICYDRGYASYKQLVMRNEESEIKPVFKLRQFVKDYHRRPDNGSAVTIIPPLSEDEVAYAEAVAYEKEITMSLIPDFSDIDFSLYPRLIDDTNPMHRLWSDGAWIKAYMAHGCYWHKCAFCDVTLDYVKGYCPTNIKRLYEGLLSQCEKKGVYGIHFVDEAMPPALMIQFARENIAHNSPITWWGNVRFEKSFTRDVADFLAYGGLIGVSAGLESATGNGLDAIHKGTDLQSIVSACCAFKEAGILVHAYMIYGYWWEKEQDLINSMETLRQFYENGLLDSSFWHKFVLTRHSRAYKEWQEGKIPDLKPIDPQQKKNAPLFAKNGLHFEGEKKSEKYGPALEFSLNQWMHGQDIQKNIQKWFNFPVPRPTVPKNFIAKMISHFESSREACLEKHKSSEALTEGARADKFIWLGGEKIPLPNGKIGWFYMGEFYTAKKDAPLSEFLGKGLCVL
ncbi:MAG: radical SAM protein [Treponema sp.]|nr:radical SAM protein [Treponema sp.]